MLLAGIKHQWILNVILMCESLPHYCATATKLPLPSHRFPTCFTHFKFFMLQCLLNTRIPEQPG